MRSLASLICALCLLAAGASSVKAADTWTKGPGYLTEALGDESAPTPGTVHGGFLLSGGGDWNLNAFRWFAAHAGNGHIVVLSASDETDGHKEFYNRIGGLKSVRLFLFRDRRASYDQKLLNAVRHADGIFFGGGDQANYVRMWRGTPLNRVIDRAVASGKPIGGTSAGLAVQGAWLYGAMDGDSITAEKALSDPLGPGVTIIGHFFHSLQLANIITDSHFDTRQRLGRLIAFLVKARTLAPHTKLAGLGIDENACVTVEPDGEAHFYADSPDKHAWLVTGGSARDLRAGKPLNGTGFHVTGINAGSQFNVLTQHVESPAFERIYDVRNGVLSDVRAGR